MKHAAVIQEGAYIGTGRKGNGATDAYATGGRDLTILPLVCFTLSGFLLSCLVVVGCDMTILSLVFSVVSKC
ncbi:hypothetical protein Hanom_Chr16g01446391 [Helianthus anomalus]